MKRAINDATPNKIGDIFQYYIALKECFGLKKGETITIEVQGDISKLNKNKGVIQKEVKHHLSQTYITERGIDFWKTIANWYESYNDIKEYNSLILFTTAIIKDKSVFDGWNDFSQSQKLAILKEIGQDKKKEEKEFRKQYNRIFNESYDETKLLDILEKFSIESAKPTIENISAEFTEYIRTIPEKNKDHYIAALLGEILNIVKNPPHVWKITYDEFDDFLQNNARSFVDSNRRPLPVINSEPTATENQELRKKKFVKEIEKIEYGEVISEAILDYWRMNMTAIKYFQNDPVYNSDISQYKQDLESRMKSAKRDSKIDKSANLSYSDIQLSQKLYNKIIGWPAEDFGSIIKNQGYFQHGIIHDIVDDGAFTWKLEVNIDEYKKY